MRTRTEKKNPISREFIKIVSRIYFLKFSKTTAQNNGNEIYH